MLHIKKYNWHEKLNEIFSYCGGFKTYVRMTTVVVTDIVSCQSYDSFLNSQYYINDFVLVIACRIINISCSIRKHLFSYTCDAIGSVNRMSGVPENAPQRK